MTARVCVFGVDAMDSRLIAEWIESGSLPNLARLHARSAWGDVLNPPRFFAGASWPNFYTGQRPARHDQYIRTVYDPKTCGYEPFQPGSDEAAAFWLSDEWSGKRTAIVNLPFCPVDARLNGTHLFDLYSHDRDHKGSLGDCDGANCSTLPRADCFTVGSGIRGVTDFRDLLLDRIRKKTEIACRVLDSEPWDLFATVIEEGHCAGHQFWHLHDASHPRHDPRMAATVGDPIKDVYIEIDKTFGKIVDLLDESSTVLLLSTHGMGPAFDGNAILDEVLRRIEGLAPRNPDETQVHLRRLARWSEWSKRLPETLQSALVPLRRRFGRQTHKEQRAADARSRRCFWLPTNDLYGGIRINLMGREAHGRVQPGEDYERFVAQLTGELHQLRDSVTGEPVVAEIVRASDVPTEGYRGERPDLIVHWKQAAFKAIESSTVGRIESTIVYGRTGDHRPEMRGVFYAAGPHITPGCLAQPVLLEDFAPTISHWLDIDLLDTAGSTLTRLCGRDCSLAAGASLQALHSQKPPSL